MKNSARKISLTSYDNIFKADSGSTTSEEQVVQIPISQIHDFPNHPFSIRDDDTMKEMVKSVETYGVLVPTMLRLREGGGYEMVAGHRRKHASIAAGKATLPAIVRNLDRDAATIIMVDSNPQRENILPSERAKAYKMKMEALKRQGQRTDLTSSQHGTKLRADEIIAEQTGSSRNQVQRYVRLNELTPRLQNLVDEGKIGLTPAVELSYLKPNEQSLLLETIDSEQSTPSLSQAQRMKKLSQEGGLNEDSILSIMSEQKKPTKNDIILPGDKLRKYFPKSYTPRQIESTIFRLLDAWQRKRQQEQSR